MDQTLTTKKFTGSTLKIIAITIMVIDHIAVGIISPYMDTITDRTTQMILYYTYTWMRIIGRLGFPIFSFLLVEGFLHTKNIKKYVINLGLFCLISEIPFDLLFRNKIFDMGYQNIFFTLFIALLALIGIQKAENQYKDKNAIKWGLILIITIVACYVAHILKTDYSGFGIILITSFYLFRNSKFQPILAIAVSFFFMPIFYNFSTLLAELPATFAVPLIYQYNGQRGKNIKYFFYLFYPVHIIIIYIICQMLIS